MSVRKQKRVNQQGKTQEFWIVDIKYKYDDGRVERVRRVPRRQTRAAAERLEREILDALENNKFKVVISPPPLVPKFSEFANEFMEVYARTHNKPSEMASKRRIFKLHLLPFFGNIPINEISSRQVDSYKAKKLEQVHRQNKKFTPKSVNNHLAVLAKVLKTADEWNVSKIDTKVKFLKTTTPEIFFLGFEDAERLVRASHLPWLTSMIVLALNTGLRIGELLALRWVDVDLACGKILVRQNLNDDGSLGTPKSGRHREVPLNERAHEALQTLNKQSNFVFSKKDGTLMTRMRAYGPLLTAMRAAGIGITDARTGWHMLRHSFASHLVMRGVPLKAVQELLGHQSMEMTLRYAHLSPVVRRDAVNALSRGNLGATSKNSVQKSK